MKFYNTVKAIKPWTTGPGLLWTDKHNLVCYLMNEYPAEPVQKRATVVPTKSDSDVVFYLLRYQGLIIDISLVY